MSAARLPVGARTVGEGTPVSTGSLHLLHTRPDPRLLAAWVAERHARHEHQALDLGDAFHGLLRAAFGPQAPQPFRYIDERQGLLAYTTMDARAIEAQVALADPLAADTLGLSASGQGDGYRLRAFPDRWREGQVLGFEVRVRPTVRSAQGECDAFLHAAALADGAPLQRDAVYGEWLRSQLGAREGSPRQVWQDAVEVLDVRLAAFRLLPVVRRTQGVGGKPRKARPVQGPDAVLSGTLRVRDSAAFACLLARGIGRHRAFGFGMLLLRRAG